MTEQNLQNRFRRAHEFGNILSLRTLRLNILDETVKIAQNSRYEVDGKTVTLPDPGEMMSGSVLYTDPGEVRMPACTENSRGRTW